MHVPKADLVSILLPGHVHRSALPADAALCLCHIGEVGGQINGKYQPDRCSDPVVGDAQNRAHTLTHDVGQLRIDRRLSEGLVRTDACIPQESVPVHRAGGGTTKLLSVDAELQS